MATGETTGRIRRGVRRGSAVLALGVLGALAGAVLAAPAANAASVITIGKTAPAPVSVNPGDTVTFTNGIPTFTVTVPGPLPVTATVATNAILGGACGGRTLAPGASFSQAFSATSTCPVSFAYSVTGAELSAVQALLPPLPAPVQAVVNVIAQAVSNPPTSAPAPPPVPAPTPAPTPPPTTAPAPAPAPSAGSGGGGTTTVGSGGTTTTTSSTSQPATGGDQQVAPSGQGGVASFEPGRFTGRYTPFQSTPGGSAGRGTGTYDGASVPVFGQLAGLSGNRLADAASTTGPAANAVRPAGDSRQLPIAAVAAVVALAGVTAALVRTHQLHRASR